MSSAPAGIDALPVDVGRVVNDLDQDRAEPALPHPALDAFGGQRKARLVAHRLADDDFGRKQGLAIHASSKGPLAAS